MKLKTTPWHLECHNCHGEGSIEWTATSWNGNQSSSRGHSETCEYCNGEGSYEIPGWVSEKDISECCPTYFRKEDIEDFLDPEALAQWVAERQPHDLEVAEEEEVK